MSITDSLQPYSEESEQLNQSYTTTLRPKKYLQPGHSAAVKHPTRPIKPEGWVYDRVDTEFDRKISFKAIDPEQDLATFHRWQNDPLVSRFWEMAESEDTLAKYLLDQLHDPHTLGLIGYLNDQPFGYFEAYWCQEDRLGAYYDSDEFDRGWHGLTGSRQHLGRKNTLTWIKGLCDYLFSDHSATERLMGEPRADNLMLLRYAEQIPYQKMCEFDFPHKRSALMQLTRNDFYETVKL